MLPPRPIPSLHFQPQFVTLAGSVADGLDKYVRVLDELPGDSHQAAADGLPDDLLPCGTATDEFLEDAQAEEGIRVEKRLARDALMALALRHAYSLPDRRFRV